MSDSRQIFIFTAGDLSARAHLDDSIRRPIDLAHAIAHTVESGHPQLLQIHEQYEGLYAWGAVPGKMNNALYRLMHKGDWVLCVYDKTFHFVAQVVHKIASAELAKSVWGTLPDGQTWELMYFLTKPTVVRIPIAEAGGYFPSQFMGFSKPKTSIPRIVKDYGSVDEYMRQMFGITPVAVRIDEPVMSSPGGQANDVVAEPIEAEEQYFLIRSNASSPWSDEIGVTYHFGSSVPNQLKLRKGGYVIVDRKSPSAPTLIGWGQLAPADEDMSLEEGSRLVGRFTMWEPCISPVAISDATLQHIRTLPGYNAQDAITPVTKEVFERLVDEMSAQASSGRVTPEYPSYSIEDALKDLFCEKAKLEEYVALIQRKKNLVLQGPPGVGKTFFAQRLARVIAGTTDPSQTAMVQFHQSYSYEDFIQGYRPKEEGGFQRKDGLFFSFCEKARQYPEKPFVFVIDEINRGNLSKIFGEVMMLIEADKRGENWAVPLTYSKDFNETFCIPENVYLLGLMNTADRSLAMVDYALRRRFVFFDMAPALNTSQFSDHLISRGATDEMVDTIRNRIGALNSQIVADRNLGPGFTIGHSYFTAGEGVHCDAAWYSDVIRYEIAPLVREYWFDRPLQDQDAIIEQLLP